MKGKVTPKTGLKRTITPLIGFLFSIMIAEYFIGCSQPPERIPEELYGKYITAHPKYRDQFFELSSEQITLVFSGGKRKLYKVRRIGRKIFENRILYTVLCTNKDGGEEFNLIFFTDFAEKWIIHFKSKPEVAWEKQEPEIS